MDHMQRMSKIRVLRSPGIQMHEIHTWKIQQTYVCSRLTPKQGQINCSGILQTPADTGVQPNNMAKRRGTDKVKMERPTVIGENVQSNEVMISCD